MAGTEQKLEEIDYQEIESIRALNHVRLIDEIEEGTAAADLSYGVYGFTWAPQSEAPLFRKQGFQSFEIHKAADGEIYLIGFVSEDDANRIAKSEEEFYINLFPTVHENATKAINIARSHILQHKDPTRNAGKSIKLKLKPRSNTV